MDECIHLNFCHSPLGTEQLAHFGNVFGQFLWATVYALEIATELNNSTMIQQITACQDQSTAA